MKVRPHQYRSSIIIIEDSDTKFKLYINNKGLYTSYSPFKTKIEGVDEL